MVILLEIFYLGFLFTFSRLSLPTNILLGTFTSYTVETFFLLLSGQLYILI